MGDDAALIQFGGSLLAILALAWIAARLKLGNDDPIRDEAHAADLAGGVVHGFLPVETAIGADGRSAIMRDTEGRVVLLRRHGAHFAGRLLAYTATARANDGILHIDTGERRFGGVDMAIANPSAWVHAIEAIEYSRYA